MISILLLSLQFLEAELAAAKVKGAAPDALALIEKAIAAVQAVHTTDVTYSQLESFRFTPKW